MSKKLWPKNRVIVEVAEIKGRCPVYKVGDVMVIRPMCYISNTIDHRVIDGFQSNAFLTELVSTLENWA